MGLRGRDGGAQVLRDLHGRARDRAERSTVDVDELVGLTQSTDGLVHSYVHMHVNRMIRSSQRAQELVLYDLLRRLYDGQAARSKQQIKKTA